MEFQKIAIIGSGFMGSGIAQVCAQAGYQAVLVDIDELRLEKALESVEWSVGKLVSKGALKESMDTILGRIETASSYDAACDADLLIEAVYEEVNLKEKVLSELDEVCGLDTVFASNTSTIPITKLAAATNRANRVIGMHFFGPVPLMRLVEIIPNPQTTDEVVQAALEFARSVGKNPILVKEDIPGFLMNRIFGAMTCEAIRLLERGAGSIEDIDNGMCDGFSMHVGPLCIADLAGLDVSLNAFNVMHALDPDYAPVAPELLHRLVSEGKLGAKTGEGFYRWDEFGKRLGPAF
ncbi:MAG: 3-hydroxyacyl-CoA dehydrogenase family protein [Candidatus Hydrogenedentes bacterium]|nr:3-hydroxyacyl-CoA dehydrogenase family protein [Candidatus Hydrogenedentota bacterium]